ncbi:MAG: O-antigen ligase domain-containing protein [Bacteroidales bacterium]
MDQHAHTIKHSIYFTYFWITLLFGVYFYEFIGLKFVDELLEAILLVIFSISFLLGKTEKLGRDIIIFIFALFFYSFYSFYIHSNVTKGILSDIIIQIKPFTAFFCFYYAKIQFNAEQKIKLKWTVYLLFLFSLYTVLEGAIKGDFQHTFMKYFAHESRFSTGLVVLALLYMYCTDLSKRHILIFICMLTLGLLSAKGKFFGFYAASVMIMIFMNKEINLKFNLKTISTILALLLIVGWAARDKILFYFVNFSIQDEDSLARPMLYYVSFLILLDYFPFGSGFASFATSSSGAYYSDIYQKYNIDQMWGLSKDDPMFVSDTHYPSLAQFGVIGIILFFAFWIRIVKQTNFLKSKTLNQKNYILILLIIIFLGIELVADATFTYNRGFFVMMLMALLLNEMRFQSLSKNIKKIDV